MVEEHVFRVEDMMETAVLEWRTWFTLSLFIYVYRYKIMKSSATELGRTWVVPVG